MKFKVEDPFIFNSWKHHKSFVMQKIGFYVSAGENAFTDFRREIKQIGDSQTDFYYGYLETNEIIREISLFLLNEGATNYKSYHEWLMKDTLMYKVIGLSDGSAWVLRLGIDKKKFIHFHPGRKSLLTLRINASTLKSAVASLIWAGIHKLPSLKISTVNEARSNLLSLPAVKNFSLSKSIFKVIELLKE